MRYSIPIVLVVLSFIATTAPIPAPGTEPAQPTGKVGPVSHNGRLAPAWTDRHASQPSAAPQDGSGGYLIATFAGGPPLPPTPAPGTSVSVSYPSGIVTDSAGNVYVASGELSAVFKLDTAGILTRVAGNGMPGYSGDGGAATAAQLSGPEGITLDAAGNLYIADYSNYRVRKVDASTGVIITVAGGGVLSGQSVGDGGPATAATLVAAAGVAVDAAGNIYIADGASRVRKVTASTGVISTVAGNGFPGYGGDGGPATNASLWDPWDVALDAAGNLYIAEYWNNRIRKVDALTGVITTVAGNGQNGYSGDGGAATGAQLANPMGVAVDAAGNIYIADFTNERVRMVAASTGVITTVAGNGTCCYLGDGGPATSAQLADPAGVTLDAAGNLYIADYHRIRKVDLNGDISTLAGNGALRYSGDSGPATSAGFSFPFGSAIDGSGNLYVADAGNNVVRKIDMNGTITTVAGNGSLGFSGDGGPATQASLGPTNVAVDADGNLYIADHQNARIRQVVASTGIIGTIAGNGNWGYSGDGGSATNAELDQPEGITVDSSGNVYFADTGNSAIRRIDAKTAVITTVAGSPEVQSPYGVALDAAGNLYVASTANCRILEIDPKGIVTTVAGNGTQGRSGDGGLATSAQLGQPFGVAVDAGGNLYIADTYNNRIRKVTASTGIINTIAGNGTQGRSGDGGPGAGAELDFPESVVVDSSGDVYFADSDNNAVRRLTPAGGTAVLAIAATHGSFVAGQGGAYTVTVANAASAGATTGTITVTDVVPAGLTLTSMSGAGWNCSANTCTRNDALSGGNSFPAITVTVNSAADVPSQVTNEAIVSGGGAPTDSALDFTLIATNTTPALAITKMHSLNFSPGEQSATYTVVVTDGIHSGPSSGTVQVTDTLPTGLSPVSMSGDGWSCASNVCTRDDALNTGASYPAISVVVNVASNASIELTNQASVSGGGSNPANASDLTVAELPPPSFPVPLAPINGASGLPQDPVLTWSAASGALSYDVYLATHANLMPFVANTTGLSYVATNLIPGTTYWWSVCAHNLAGANCSLPSQFTTHPILVMKIGTYNSGQWLLDLNGNGTWDGDPPDLSSSFAAGLPGATYVTGDWNGDGHVKIGVYYQGFWYLDLIGNGIWDGGVVDKQYSFGWSDPNVIPVVGDWNGDGRSKIGVYYQGFWYLDYNGNGVWDGPSVDKAYNFGWAAAGVTPMLGDWTGNGTTKIGIYYDGFWYLDFIGNGIWDGGVVDKAYTFGWAAAGVTPIVGDWDADGRTKIGIYFNGDWFLDYDGDGVWDGGVNDKAYVFGASSTVTPLIGDWSGDGRAKIGFFANGHWYLDYNGNGAWDGNATDRLYTFGNTAGTAIVGAW